jgi:hypothetical protein
MSIAGALVLVIGFAGTMAALTGSDARESGSANATTSVVFFVIGGSLLFFGVRAWRHGHARSASLDHGVQFSASKPPDISSNTARVRLRVLLHWTFATPTGLILAVGTIAAAVFLPAVIKMAPVVIFTGCASGAVHSRIQKAQRSHPPVADSQASGESETR